MTAHFHRRATGHSRSGNEAAALRIAVTAGLTLAASLTMGSLARAEDIAVAQGRRIAEANCSKCHAVGKIGDSPLAIAPAFRTLHEKYPVEDLEESLAEGISTGHPTMPQFRFDVDQIKDFIAYLKSLEPSPSKGG